MAHRIQDHADQRSMGCKRNQKVLSSFAKTSSRSLFMRRLCAELDSSIPAVQNGSSSANPGSILYAGKFCWIHVLL